MFCYTKSVLFPIELKANIKIDPVQSAIDYLQQNALGTIDANGKIIGIEVSTAKENGRPVAIAPNRNLRLL